MEVLRQEGPVKRERKVEDSEEVLPDGTVHHLHRERSSSFKSVRKCVRAEDGSVKVVEETKEEIPGTLKEDLVETFEGPAHPVRVEQDIDEVGPDGIPVHKHVVHSRLVHHIHTHHESFDSDHGRREEDYDEDEVVPGTECAFVTADNGADEDSLDSIPESNGRNGVNGSG